MNKKISGFVTLKVGDSPKALEPHHRDATD
jgi:hypothetical protein